MSGDRSIMGLNIETFRLQIIFAVRWMTLTLKFGIAFSGSTEVDPKLGDDIMAGNGREGIFYWCSSLFFL